MRRLLLGQGCLLILIGITCAITAPWSSTALIETLAIAASAIFQTGGCVTLALVYTDQLRLVVAEEREEPSSEIVMNERRRKSIVIRDRGATDRRAVDAVRQEQQPRRRALAAHAAPQGAA